MATATQSESESAKMLESFVQEALAHDLGTEISKTLANLRTENITTAGLLCSVLQLWPKPLENIANLTLGVCIALKNHAIQKGLIQNQDQKQDSTSSASTFHFARAKTRTIQNAR